VDLKGPTSKGRGVRGRGKGGGRGGGREAVCVMAFGGWTP